MLKKIEVGYLVKFMLLIDIKELLWASLETYTYEKKHTFGNYLFLSNISEWKKPECFSIIR
jgi:hypothetical protein